MGTLRIRGGYAVGSFLPYLFGGVALGQANITETAHIYGTQVNPAAVIPNIPVDLSATDGIYSHLIYGYSAGIGVDVIVWQACFCGQSGNMSALRLRLTPTSTRCARASATNSDRSQNSVMPAAVDRVDAACWSVVLLKNGGEP